jgi:Rad3-related DNA helicase
MNATAGRASVPLILCVTQRNDTSNADAYRFLIRHAMKEDLVPAQIEIKGVERVSVFFPAALSARIQETADTHNMTFQQAAAGLAAAGADALAMLRTEDVKIEEKIPFRNISMEQAKYFSLCRDALANSKILVAEGSTGLGKTRALVVSAILAAQQGKKPVIIAAPTVEIVGHFWAELEKVQNEGIGLSLTAAIAPGARDFVDDAKLKAWLIENPGQDMAVEEWVAAGGELNADPEARAPVIRSAESLGVKLAWMMEDLTRIATNIPLLDFERKSATDENGVFSESAGIIAELRAALNRKTEEGKHHGADLIFCTHTMLAFAQLCRWQILPQPKVLIIDEAHLLEETISRVNSDELSVFSLSYRIARHLPEKNKKKSAAGTAYTLAVELKKLCQSLCKEDNKTTVSLKGFPDEKAAIISTLVNLANAMESKAFADFPKQKRDIYDLRALAATMSNGNNRTDIRFSPKKDYPLITSGSADIGASTGELWKLADGGVILASATLYTVDDYGEYDCRYVVKNLAIPLTRIDTPPPVIFHGVFDIPTLYTPGLALSKQLCRPTKGNRTVAADKQWLECLGQTIATEVVNSAVGGTLVLLTAYTQIESIKSILETAGVAPERIVEQRRDERFSVAKAAFTQIYRDGERPILLALGPAWTGLDLADKSVAAFNDFLLTDLVIGCAPIGLNQSPTMLRRKEIWNMEPIIKEALLTLKQGLGRLIRRDGVTDRRLWIMDGRIFSEWPKMVAFTSSAKRLLSNYKKKSVF